MLFDLANSLRSLTLSPATAAIAQAKRQAHRYLAEGGSARATSGQPVTNKEPIDFLVPADVDALAVAQAVREKLGIAEPDGDEVDLLHPLERRKLGGRVLVSGRDILRLGDGRYDKGRAYLHLLVTRSRRHRLRQALRPR